jgi:D-alanyl-D-alanine carboxypeptidase/D-alanyl-D-alanine-endopeptidase (penicillin-binding protein 4)
MLRRLTCVFAALAAALGLCASTGHAQAAREATLAQRVAARAATFEKASAVAGVSVVDLRSGKAVVGLRADELRAPASNQKILTSAVALTRLGASYKFVTKVFELDGDVVVLGGFDPTLGDRVLAEQNAFDAEAELDAWSAAVRKAMGQKVRNIVLCSSAPAGLRHPDWPANQLDNWYAAPVAELNYNNNCIDVKLKGAGAGVSAEIAPPSRFIRVVSQLRQGPANWSVKIADDCSAVTVQGQAQGAAPARSIAVDSPQLLLGRVLADRLAAAGVTVTGELRVTAPSSVDFVRASPLASSATSLPAVMARANKRSLNMAAECMFLAAGDGTWEGSGKVASETLVKSFGLKPQQFAIRDGSGLSPRDRVSPAAMTTLLASLVRHRDARAFIDSLPVSGVDGTMTKRLDVRPYRQRVLGKTGYIAGVSALSGYVLDSNGKPAYAFSVLCNQISGPADAKSLEDDICRMLVDSLD